MSQAAGVLAVSMIWSVKVAYVPVPNNKKPWKYLFSARDEGIHYLCCCILSAMLHYSFAKAPMQNCYVSKPNHCTRLSEYSSGSVFVSGRRILIRSSPFVLLSFAFPSSDIITVCAFLRCALGSMRSLL